MKFLRSDEEFVKSLSGGEIQKEMVKRYGESKDSVSDQTGVDYAI